MGPMTVGRPPGTFSRILMPPVTLVAGLAALGWLDVFHASLAAASLLLAAVVALRRRDEPTWRSPRRGKLDRGSDLRPATANREPERGVLYFCLTGVVRGVLLLMVVAAASLVASFIPALQAIVLDRDRPAVELKLDALEQAQDWAAAADLITVRLQRRLSRDFRDALLARQYQAFVQAGAATSGQHARAFFEQALNVAQENGLNTDLAVAHLERLKLHDALQREEAAAKGLVDQKGRRDADFARLSGQMDQLQQRFATAQTQSDQLRGQLREARAENADNQKKATQAKIELLLGWGDALDSNLPERRVKYSAALALAQDQGLDTAVARARLAELDRLIQVTQPIALPKGAQAHVVRVSTADFPPILVLDLRVVAPGGMPIDGLAAKDFQVHAGREPVSLVALTRVQPQASPIQLVVLFDRSNSTAGAPFEEAKANLSVLLSSLQGTAQVRLIAFSTEITPLANWTAKPGELVSPLQQLTADGNTALQAALGRAADELATRPGPKAVVLFTDGKDTVGGPDPQQLTARFHKAGIAIHVVALHTADLDREFLTKLTTATGGALLTAVQSSELGSRFRAVAHALNCPVYRLVVVPRRPCDRLQVQVGGENAVRVDCALTSFPQASSTSLSASNRKEIQP